MKDPVTLADWRRRIAELYVDVRRTPLASRQVAWQDWRAGRNHLLKSHPESPLHADQLSHFRGLPYFEYNPGWQVAGDLEIVKNGPTYEIDLTRDGIFRYRRAGKIKFSIQDSEGELSLYWVEGYGGGLFLPFRDRTNGRETFGGGRYLYDTIKGADLGASGDKIDLDFNFAYNPSCAYHSKWVCPLPPPENTLSFPVKAGEKDYPS